MNEAILIITLVAASFNGSQGTDISSQMVVRKMDYATCKQVERDINSGTVSAALFIDVGRNDKAVTKAHAICTRKPQKDEL